MVLAIGCSKENPVPAVINGPAPLAKSTICKVEEIEFRDRDDQITGIRDFKYNVNLNNRLESITIVEGLDLVPLTLRFEFHYNNGEQEVVPTRMDEIFGGDVVTNTVFKYDQDGNLIELAYNQLAEPFTGPPEFQVFFYEESELANDSINARIIIFDIDRLTRDWIDVLPAIFTHGGRRITRFQRLTFRDEVLSFCDFSYDSKGFLSAIVCRTGDGILRDVWDFTYQDDRLISAFRQQPNFRHVTSYEYDQDSKPTSVVSTSGERVNWKAAFYYVCR